ncbi:MAG: methylated-DNA--[protein]-cysteine S-methyltransferase [Thermodesulfobacteriota bacterium]
MQSPGFPSFFSCHAEGGGLRLHCIIRDDRLLHSSFSREQHDRAVAYLCRTLAVAPPPVCVGVPDLLRPVSVFLEGHRRDLPLAADPFFLARGTDLQQQVWQILRTIPFGETLTYGEVASMLGNPGLARAVGQACGRNPLALFIPCHRVVGRGGLTGFAGGIGVKRRLLQIEREVLSLAMAKGDDTTAGGGAGAAPD